MNSIPCCKFQTETVLVDDNPEQLLALSLIFSTGKGHYRFFDDPTKALSYLQEQTPLCTDKPISRAECPVPDDLYFRANLDEIKCYADRASKAHKVGVVFMDYLMPGVNGLQVLERIRLPHIERILLTGAADEKLAVHAFNRGQIHRYISKREPQLNELIQEALETGQQNYFRRSTQTLFSILTSDEQETALTDASFIQFFTALKAKLNILEYYLTDATGSFLLIDAKKTRYKLSTYTQEQFQSLLETLPAQRRTVETIRGRQIYHCILSAGFTPCRELRGVA